MNARFRLTPWLRRDGIVLAVYSLLAIGLTYPLVVHLGTHVPGRGIDDPALAWNLWWLKYAVFNLGTSPLSTDYIYYPVGVNLVAYTSTFLNGVISLPFQFLFGVIVANNLTVYFALAIGGYGVFLLAREILARLGIAGDLAAALAGAFYAFGAWHINYVAAGHIMLLSNEWIPFFALYLVRSDRGRWRSGALAGLFFVMTAWTELTFIPFVALLTLFYLAYLGIVWVAGMRSRAKPQVEGSERSSAGGHPTAIERSERSLARAHPTTEASRPTTGARERLLLWLARGHRLIGSTVLANLLALGVVAAVGVSPLLASLMADFARWGYYLAPGLGRVAVFSAEPISFFIPSFTHPLLGAWGNALTNANTSYAFVGFAVLVLAALGFYSQRSSGQARLWGVLVLLFASIVLGPALIVGGESTGVPLPFALLRAIPLVNANRYPVRFNAMLMFSLTPLVALGAAYLLRTRRAAILAGLTLVLAFEQLALPIPLTDLSSPAIFQTIRSEPGDFTVLDLPLGWRNSVAIQGKIDYTAQFLQAVDEKRLIGGLTSRNPAFKFQYYLEQPVLNSIVTLENGGGVDDSRRAQDRAAAPVVLRFFDIRYVEVQRASTAPEVLQYALDVLPLQEIYRDDTRIVYRVTDKSAPPARIDSEDETARLYYDDGWGRVQSANGASYRWATRGDARLWLPLERADQQIAFRLRGTRAGQAIAVGVNGQNVGTVAVTDAWSDYSVQIPAAVVRESLNEVTFSTETVPAGSVRMDDYAIGDTGVSSPVDIVATSAGFDAGRFGELYVASRNVTTGERGYHLAAVDPKTGTVDRVGSFDTFADASESTRLADFVNQLPQGEIVAGVAVDEVSRRLAPAAVDALRQLGVETDLRYQFRAGHAFIGVKGAQPGQALERVNGRWPANVAAGANVTASRLAFALGDIRFGNDPTR